jgi:NAD-dependent deacetylase
VLIILHSRSKTTDIQDKLRSAASLIRAVSCLTAFTGAGVSVESGIPPFRGEGGLWSNHDPLMLEVGCFLAHPEKSRPILRDIFYAHFGKAKPNRAHEVLAAWEARGILKTFITQNIDSVHLN